MVEVKEEMVNGGDISSRNRVPGFSEKKLGLISIHHEVDELTHLLAFCYDTWWRRMKPRKTQNESLPASCYYCHLNLKSRQRLKSHMRKYHRQLYNSLPFVLLERIKLEGDKIHTECNSLSTSLSREKCGNAEICRDVYHCADCAHSSTSRLRIKVHIFTRHIFKKLYVKYSLKYFGVSRYFIGVKRNIFHNVNKPSGPPFHYHGLPLVSLQHYLVKNDSHDKTRPSHDQVIGDVAKKTPGRDYSTTYACSYCQKHFNTLTELGVHIVADHVHLLKYLPVVKLERAYLENNGKELSSHGLYSNQSLPEVKIGRQPFEDTKTDQGYYTQLSNCGSSIEESPSTYSRMYSSPLQSKGTQTRVYHCSECVYLTCSRWQMKIHAFTMHIYKILYASRPPIKPSSRARKRARLSSCLPIVKLVRLSVEEIEANSSIGILEDFMK